MAYVCSVLYGRPTDTEKFDSHYFGTHLPLARKTPGLRIVAGKCDPGAPGETPPYYLVALVYADSRAALDTAFATPEGKAAIADLANFVTGGVTFVYSEAN